MKVYLDTSVILRVVYRDPRPFPRWGRWEAAYSSRIWYTESLRSVDRARLTGAIQDEQVARLRTDLDIIHEHLHIVPLTEAILQRAGEPFATVLGTLDALHLATALQIRESVGLEVFLTHDVQLATAAAGAGFAVQGV